jgi:hypothetical protein
VIEPFIGNIVIGIHDAFSLAVAQTFYVGIAAAAIAAIAAATMHEHALRTSTGPATAPKPSVAGNAPAGD